MELLNIDSFLRKYGKKSLGFIEACAGLMQGNQLLKFARLTTLTFWV